MKKYIDTIKNKIAIEDLDEIYQDIATIIGIDNYIKLCEEYGGTRVMLPKIKTLTKNYTYRKVIELKDAISKEQLARMFNLSESTIYKIINKYEGKC